MHHLELYIIYISGSELESRSEQIQILTSRVSFATPIECAPVGIGNRGVWKLQSVNGAANRKVIISPFEAENTSQVRSAQNVHSDEEFSY